MLLTVIAVATLLVAVVGATFAYFSLSVSGSATNTTANVATPTVSTATLSGLGAKLHLKLSEVDMNQTNEDTYYALDEKDPLYSSMKETSSIHSKGVEKKYEIANITLAGAAEDTTYTCNYTVKVETATDLTGVAENDLVLNLYTAVGPEVSGSTETQSLAKIDLSKLEYSDTYSKTQSGTFELTNTNTKGVIGASLALKNSEKDQTSALKEKNIDFTISVTGSSCTVAAAVD